MKYKALISAHIWVDDGIKDIEILDRVDNGNKATDIFCDVDHALLDQIDIGENEDYFFMAIVESEFIKTEYWEGTEYDVEHDVKEIKNLEDVVS